MASLAWLDGLDGNILPGADAGFFLASHAADKLKLELQQTRAKIGYKPTAFQEWFGIHVCDPRQR
jgi:hypothetical protein